VAQVLSASSDRLDETAFEGLIGPLIEPGLRLAYSMLGDRAEAEDATQDAITRAWKSLPQLRDRSKVRPWFLAIIANQCRNVRRTRWFGIVRIAEVFRPARAAEEGIEKLDLERALARLPRGDRQLLFMRFYLDLPIEEIAVTLGISPAAAKGRVYRAAHRLRPDLVEEDI
jgi:RNA polymerase sigma-70 factor (ECF subfamily)